MQVTFKVIKRGDIPHWYFVNGFCEENREAFNLTGFAGKFRPVLPGKVSGQNEMTLGFRRPDFTQEAVSQILEVCGDMIDSFYVYEQEPEYERVVELGTCEVQPIEIVPVDASQPVESE